MQEKVFNVEGMSCNHCVAAVKEAVLDIDGVSECVVDLEKKTATATYADTVTESDIIEAIKEEGFDVV